jgi:uridine kinase
MKKVDIRFNTNFPSKSQYEWRVLIDGIETLVNNVRIETPCYTTSTFIEGHGMKWHLSTNASNIDFTILPNNKIATIK